MQDSLEDLANSSSKSSNEKLNKLEPIAPSLGVHYPSNPTLKYQYPEATVDIVENIATTLLHCPRFYNQVLHLMNKMNLPPPFRPIDPEIKELIDQKIIQESAVNSTFTNKNQSSVFLSNSESKFSFSQNRLKKESEMQAKALICSDESEELSEGNSEACTSSKLSKSGLPSSKRLRYGGSKRK
ncbi:hypothetical protein DSO57_1023405 [Entomophthora muscae]|uniref:Uncharacterized protein n=1 Tax=Entomophthora muscae TaxID=34485 RepID=A0ACC2U189_9FUNG|nr:hypothetical protein DSO57_1023405 [Entomophthora muscae]